MLVHEKSQEEHDHRLKKVLERVKQVGLTLNCYKCEFSKSCIKFLGQVIDERGVSSDPDKTQAIMQLEQPNNITEVGRYLGMLNQMSKFVPNLSLKPDNTIERFDFHQELGAQVNKEHSRKQNNWSVHPTVLALLQSFSQHSGISGCLSLWFGGVLTQKQPSGEWQPVSFILRSLTPTEQQYSQIEKEALGLTWACEHFSEYLLGINFQLETD